MLVNSIIFWQFFGFFLLPYFYLKERKMQNTWILVASYVFYGWTDWRMVGLLLLATTLFYGLATSLARVQKRQTAVQSSKFKNQSPFSVDLTKDAKLIADSASSVHTKALMIFGVVFGVGMLAYFKYMIFFIE